MYKSSHIMIITMASNIKLPLQNVIDNRQCVLNQGMIDYL